MSIYTKMLKQSAVYWPPLQAGSYGKRKFGAAVDISVRWEDTNELYVTVNGEQATSSSKVYSGVDLTVGGFLWLGTVVTLTDADNPTLNEGAGEIMRFDKIPNIKATKFLRVAYL